MKKQPKPLSTKVPPIPSNDHSIIQDWIKNSTMPAMQPIVKKFDTLVNKLIPNLYYSIKWAKAYYGTKENGWIIELAPNMVTVNIVFLKGANFQNQPPLGTGEDSRYLKLSTLAEVDNPQIQTWLKEAVNTAGWK